MINDLSEINNNKADNKSLSETDLATLRRLLLGEEYQSILKKTEILDNPVLLGELMSPSIQAALKIKDPNNNLQQVLTPVIVGGLMDSVSSDPKPIADALYPVMGPAIRKSINATMTQMTNNFNQLLEQSISPKAWQWRFDAWRTGRNYAEVVLLNNLLFQVEQVFLIHRETGLLLQHAVAETAISKDPDMVSGMLTAIQDFTHDSFSVEQSSGLNSLRLDDLTVLIENGPHAVLAAVVRGSVPQDMQETLSETIEEVHQLENKKLIDYKGDANDFDHLQPFLSECLRTQLLNKEKKKKKKSNKKLYLYGLALSLLMIASSLLYNRHHSSLAEEEWNDIFQTVNSEPGLIITNTTHENGEYVIAGLADPLATKPSLLINRGTLNNIKVRLAFRPYLSLDPKIVLMRIWETQDIPDSVKLNLEDEVLSLSGTSSRSWLKRFKHDIRGVSGIKSLDTSKIELVK